MIIFEYHGRVWLVTAEVELARQQNKENGELMKYEPLETGGVRYFLIHQNDPDPRERAQDGDSVTILEATARKCSVVEEADPGNWRQGQSVSRQPGE